MSMSNTNSEGKTPAELEREVNEQRSRVSSTVDALQDKISVKGVVTQVMDAMSEHGGDISRNLGKTVKDNPLPLLLTGIGIVWLIASANQRGSSSDYDSRGEAYPSSERTSSTVGSRPTAYGVEPAATFKAGSSKTSSGPAGGAETGDESGGGIKDKARDAAGSVKETVKDGAQRVKEAVDDARDQAAQTASRVAERTNEVGQYAKNGFDKALDDHPLVLGALALAAGAAIGGALPRTKREDEMLGQHSDRLKEQAQSVAQEQLEKAKAVGEKVADEAKAMAGEAAGKLDEKTPDGSTLVNKVDARAREAVERLKKTGKDEAEKQGLGKRQA